VFEFQKSTIFCFAVLSGRDQARDQLATLGATKSFLRGAQFFETISNIFKTRPTHFSRGTKKF